MLEGASRWNMGRAKEAVAVEGASTLRTFDVQLMSHLNSMSQRVLGCPLVPEFTPSGKPTGKRDLRATLVDQSITSPPPLFLWHPLLTGCAFLGCEDCAINVGDGCVYACPFFTFVFILVTGERIAVDYLLAQTNRGDLLAQKQIIPSQVLEEDEDEPEATLCILGDLGAGDHWDEAESDTTFCQSAELGAGDPDPPSAVEDQVLLEGDTEPGPLVTEVSHTFCNTLLKNTVLNQVNLVTF